MTIIDCRISLKMIKKILVVLGVVDMRQLLLRGEATNSWKGQEHDMSKEIMKDYRNFQ